MKGKGEVVVVSKGSKLCSYVANTWAGLEAWCSSCQDDLDDTVHLGTSLNFVNPNLMTGGFVWAGCVRDELELIGVLGTSRLRWSNACERYIL